MPFFQSQVRGMFVVLIFASYNFTTGIGSRDLKLELRGLLSEQYDDKDVHCRKGEGVGSVRLIQQPCRFSRTFLYTYIDYMASAFARRPQPPQSKLCDRQTKRQLIEVSGDASE